MAGAGTLALAVRTPGSVPSSSWTAWRRHAPLGGPCVLPPGLPLGAATLPPPRRGALGVHSFCQMRLGPGPSMPRQALGPLPLPDEPGALPFLDGWSCGPLPSPGGPGTVAMSPPFTTRAWGPVLPCWVGRGSPPFARRSRASYLPAPCPLPPPIGFGAPSLPPGAGAGSPVSARRSLPSEVSLESPPFSSVVKGRLSLFGPARGPLPPPGGPKALP